MRVLMLGDMAATGFGTVTQDLGRAMLDIGVDMRFISQNDTGTDLPEPFRSRTYDFASLPYRINEFTGEGGTIGAADGIPALLDGTTVALLLDGSPAHGWVPDAAIILGDFYAARHFIGRFVEAFKRVPTWHYVPIEGVGLPPEWKRLWDICPPVAMSNFGADQIETVVGYRPPMVYHGVNTDAFYPVSPQRPMFIRGKNAAVLKSKDDCKRAWLQHLWDTNLSTLERRGNDILMPRHWLLRTDRNMPRKRYEAMCRALGPVLERNEGWGLLLHCQDDQGGYPGDWLSKLSPLARSRVLFTGATGVVREQLAILYNAADLYVSVSAEGFGLTIAEAIASGVCAVGLDYSAVPEVIGPAGKVVPYTHLLDNEYSHSWAAVDEAQFARVVEHLMTHKGKREDLGRKGPAHVRTNFRWDTAARQFTDLIGSSLATGVAA